MVKEIRVTVDNGDFEKLEEKKDDRTWREAILEEFGVKNADSQQE